MCNAWKHPPNCTCGWGGEGHLGTSGSGGGCSRSFPPAPRNSVWSHQDSYAAPSTCPRCRRAVYFIRHNGGAVWVDELGWPWPKHACFDNEPEPGWSTYLRANTGGAKFHSNAASSNTSVVFNPPVTSIAGVVIEARRLEIDGQAVIALAIDGGPARRCLVAVEGDNTASYYRRCIAVLDEGKRNVVISNFKVKALKSIAVVPAHLGLPANWLEQHCAESGAAADCPASASLFQDGI